MGRRRTGLTLVVVAAASSLLAACSNAPGSHYSTSVDAERARAVWTDLWAAPTSAGPAGVAYGTNDLLDRGVGGRVTDYPSLTIVQALGLEVDAARHHGWALAAVDCEDGTAVLGRGDSVDDGMLAQVTATATEPAGSEVGVAVLVAHHLDGAWPELPVVTPSATCLSGRPDQPVPAAVTQAVEMLEGGPIDGPDRVGDVDDDPDHEWQRDSPTQQELALFEAVRDDPWVLSEQGLAEIRLERVDAVRNGQGSQWSGGVAGATGVTRDARAVLRDALAGADRWEPTYASCSPDGPAVASLRLVVGDLAAVARVSAASDGTWTASVTLPIPEGPDAGWILDAPALTDSSCLGGAPLPDGLTAQGVPVVLPGSLQPYLG